MFGISVFSPIGIGSPLICLSQPCQVVWLCMRIILHLHCDGLRTTLHLKIYTNYLTHQVMHMKLPEKVSRIDWTTKKHGKIDPRKDQENNSHITTKQKWPLMLYNQNARSQVNQDLLKPWYITTCVVVRLLYGYPTVPMYLYHICFTNVIQNYICHPPWPVKRYTKTSGPTPIHPAAVDVEYFSVIAAWKAAVGSGWSKTLPHTSRVWELGCEMVGLWWVYCLGQKSYWTHGFIVCGWYIVVHILVV